MQLHVFRSTIRSALMGALVAWATLAVGVAAATEPYAVGDAIAPFTLEDQHGEDRSVDASVKVILFSRDMDGGDYLKEALADVLLENRLLKKA